MPSPMPHSVPLRYRHWKYVWIPVAAAAMWFCTVLAMLIVYLASGRPKYVTQQGKIAYISDVAASDLKPLFIVGCAITAVGFFLSLVAERLLRNTGRLMPNMQRRERVFSILAIIGSFIGGCGLLFLSIFDTGRYPTVHRICLFIFIVGVSFSAIFSIIEYRWLRKHFRDNRQLKISYFGKGIIAMILILLAIAFAITLFLAQDVAAVLEWAIAFGFTFYLLSFYYDLRMSKNIEKGELKALAHHSQNNSQTDVMTEIV